MPLFKPNSTLYVVYAIPDFKVLFIDYEQNITSHDDAFKYARKFILAENYDIHALSINSDGEIDEFSSSKLNSAWYDWKRLLEFYDNTLIYKHRTEHYPVETYITMHRNA